jgi:hypothetical protein
MVKLMAANMTTCQHVKMQTCWQVCKQVDMFENISTSFFLILKEVCKHNFFEVVNDFILSIFIKNLFFHKKYIF